MDLDIKIWQKPTKIFYAHQMAIKFNINYFLITYIWCAQYSYIQKGFDINSYVYMQRIFIKKHNFSFLKILPLPWIPDSSSIGFYGDPCTQPSRTFLSERVREKTHTASWWFPSDFFFILLSPYIFSTSFLVCSFSHSWCSSNTAFSSYRLYTQI